MSCEDIPSLLDLQNTKRNMDDLGRLIEGTPSGYSTNENTGKTRPTFDKVIEGIGIPIVGNFTTGCTVTQSNEGVQVVGGSVYRWSGALPKVVAPYSTLGTPGGISPSGDWVDVGDASVYQRILDILSSDTGDELIGVSGGRTQHDKNRESLSLADYFAVGDLVADDSISAQNALNANKPLNIRAIVGYKITNQLTSNTEAKITGEGLLSALNFSGLPASVDAFKFSPHADGNAREYAGLSSVYILQSSGGRHAVLVDVSAAGQIVSRFKVDSSYLRANGAGNYAFAVHNPTNAADRFFLGYFENSVFDGGLLLYGAGDSLNVTGCTFTGVNEAVALVQTTELSPGAFGPSSMFVFERNNSTANKGIYIIDAQSPKIRNNNLECGSGPGAGAEQALVNILGQTKRIFGAEVTGNAILHAPNCTTGVFVGTTDGALVENNVFGVAATGYSIVVSVNAKNTRIGYNSFIPKGTGREVQDLGVGTKGVLKNATLSSGWSNVGGLEPASFIKGLDGVVRLSGIIGGGIVTSGTELFVLPWGFRPKNRQFFSTYGLTEGGVYVTAVVRVDTDGIVRIVNSSGGASALAELGFCGISFLAPDAV